MVCGCHWCFGRKDVEHIGNENVMDTHTHIPTEKVCIFSILSFLISNFLIILLYFSWISSI